MGYKIFNRKEVLTILEKHMNDSELEEIIVGLDNEGLFYGWLNGEAQGVDELLKTEGVNIDSIQQVQIVYDSLAEKFDY